MNALSPNEEDRERQRKLQSRYDSWMTKHPDAKRDFVTAITEILSDAGLAFDSVTARIKSLRSLSEKSIRRDAQGNYIWADPWHEIHDIIGIRVTTYHSTEIPDIMDALGDSLSIVRTIDKTAETRISGRLGYGSQHLICRVTSASPSELAPYEGMLFEVQLRTVLQHAWAEFEHDIRYKASDVSDPRIDRAFALAAGLIELADQQFDQVAAVYDEITKQDKNGTAHKGTNALPPRQPVDSDDVVINAQTLPGVLAMLLPNSPRSKSEHYAWAEELLTLNGIETVGQLRRLLAPSRVQQVEAAMHNRFKPGHVRIVDDVLLATEGTKHIERTENSGDQPKRRPRRLQSRMNLLIQAGLIQPATAADSNSENISAD